MYLFAATLFSVAGYVVGTVLAMLPFLSGVQAGALGVGLSLAAVNVAAFWSLGEPPTGRPPEEVVDA
ncbi:hypothetical protein SAMN04488063_0107 [Halopelagius inordinatus]|uniref:Uncharacterized protein n=2 Tax=Halopelagius inordinatus TaxID=553467 RepID=A0A1I2X2P4_9EURY|nr:hypothetical protein SAMN04488063_0107 [Halopelagius inordinatus]